MIQIHDEIQIYDEIHIQDNLKTNYSIPSLALSSKFLS